MSSWYLPAKKYAEISPSHNITLNLLQAFLICKRGRLGKPWHNGMDIFVSRLSVV